MKGDGEKAKGWRRIGWKEEIYKGEEEEEGERREEEESSNRSNPRRETERERPVSCFGTRLAA